MATCARNGYLVDAKHVIPDDPTDLAVELLPIVGCSQIECTHCNVRVKNLVGVRFKGDRQPADLAAAFANPAAFVEPSVASWRLYLCTCSSWTETSEHPLYDADPDPQRDPTMPWRCGGHPVIKPPGSVDGENIKGAADLSDVVGRVLHGWHPPGARAADHVRVAWLRRLFVRLEPVAARSLADAVVAHVGDPDPEVRGRALVFFKNVTDETVLAQLVPWLDSDRRLFAGVADSVSSISGETLEDSLWRTVGPLAAKSGRVRALLRRAARTPGTRRRAVYDVLAAHDATWFSANLEPIVRANPSQVRAAFDALEAKLEEAAMAALGARARAVLADKTPRARSLQEMLFAASLVPCPKCAARTGALELRGDGDAWVLGGKCPGCDTVRSFQFATEGNPRDQMHERLELGDGRPSAVIEAKQLVAELERLAPSLHDDPRALAPAEWDAHVDVASRAYTAAVELAKFLPSDGGAVSGLASPYDRAWIERERDRAVVRLDRISADTPRIWLLRNGGILHGTEEVRGLLNQAGQRQRPSVEDLRAYLTPRAKSTTKRATDVFVELDSPTLAAVRLWEDGRGTHAELHLQGMSAADIQDVLLGITLGVDTVMDGSLAKRLTIHFGPSAS